MSDITISYKGSSIATMDATGTKTLLTEGKYCEDDITIDYVKSGGGGGGLDYPYITGHETVTIGANSVTNTDAARTYFNSLHSSNDWFFVALKDTPSVYNQVVALPIYGQGTCLRYRNGSIGTASIAGQYDGKLIEGTQYELYYWGN